MTKLKQLEADHKCRRHLYHHRFCTLMSGFTIMPSSSLSSLALTITPPSKSAGTACGARSSSLERSCLCMLLPASSYCLPSFNASVGHASSQRPQNIQRRRFISHLAATLSAIPLPVLSSIGTTVIHWVGHDFEQSSHPTHSSLPSLFLFNV